MNRPPPPPRGRAPAPSAPSNRPAPGAAPAAWIPPLVEADIHRLQTLLDSLPEPLEPFDVSMLDGYLCGVLLQPDMVPAGAWLKHVFDIDGREVPAGFKGLNELQGLVQRRYRELNAAIAGRQWFDPWVFELDDEATPHETMLPWSAGFSTALELFPALMNRNDPEALEPMAVLYAVFDPADLEDADALIEMIETLEPPGDLDEVVEDIVQSVMRLADITRPQRAPIGGKPGGGAPGVRRGPPQRPGGNPSGKPPRR
jgi:uncharacterized protein